MQLLFCWWSDRSSLNFFYLQCTLLKYMHHIELRDSESVHHCMYTCMRTCVCVCFLVFFMSLRCNCNPDTCVFYYDLFSLTNLDYFADVWNVFIGIQLWHQCWQSQSQLNTLLAMELGRFNITLGGKTLLDGWRGIGKSENLPTDAEIAKYLVALWVMFSVTCKQWDLFSVYLQSTIWVYFGRLNFHQMKIWTLKKKKKKKSWCVLWFVCFRVHSMPISSGAHV